MPTTVQGLPAAVDLQQSILFAQAEILRRLRAQRASAQLPQRRAAD